MRILVATALVICATSSQAQTSLGNVEVARLCATASNFVRNIGAAANGNTALNVDSLLSEELDDYNLFWIVMAGRSQTIFEQDKEFAGKVGTAIACVQQRNCGAGFGQSLLDAANELNKSCRLDYLGL